MYGKTKGVKNMKKVLPIVVIGILVISGFGAIVKTGDKNNNLEENRESFVFFR